VRAYFLPVYATIGDGSHNSADQFPGAKDDYETFSAVQTYWPAGSGGGWHGFSGVVNGDRTSYIATIPGPAQDDDGFLYTWDTACTY
jgi:hypothetical protein